MAQTFEAAPAFENPKAGAASDVVVHTGNGWASPPPT